ncbi:MAG: isoprenylcysteine carboxylmethyltransferase family protein [Nitrospira sp.]|nr:isoprenylcysteine carboxylmethyltransferase family protein [Nitrospira sp.]
MLDLLALITIIVWPFIPLFWIPVHFFTGFFRNLGLITYLIPFFTWLPIAFIMYQNRVFLLQYKIEFPVVLNIIGVLLLAIGAILHIWTGKLLGAWGLIGLPEISTRIKGRLVTEGIFSVIRHPTYLAHTLMFSGIFLITGVISVGIITLLDFLIINAIVIPLEEKELLSRFGEEYKLYKKKVPRFFPVK